jgi:hypothetical protein
VENESTGGWAVFNTLFRWVKDDEGDIGIEIFGVLTLIKYKYSTIVYWFKRFDNADKYQGETKS